MRPPQTVGSRKMESLRANEVSQPRFGAGDQYDRAELSTNECGRLGDGTGRSVRTGYEREHRQAARRRDRAVTNPPTNAGPVLTAHGRRSGPGTTANFRATSLPRRPKNTQGKAARTIGAIARRPPRSKPLRPRRRYAAADPSAKDSVRRAATSRGASAVNASSATQARRGARRVTRSSAPACTTRHAPDDFAGHD